MRSSSPSTSGSAWVSRSKSSLRRRAWRAALSAAAPNRGSGLSASIGAIAPLLTRSSSVATDRPVRSASSDSDTACCSNQIISVSSMRMAAFLGEMGPRVERRRSLQLAVQCRLRLADHARHQDQHHREQVALAAFGRRQAAPRQTQMPSGLGSGRDFELHRTTGGRHLHRSTQYRLPWCERQIQIQVVTAGTEQRVRSQADIQIEIAVASAIETLTPLARHPQSLPVAGAFGNARLEGVGHAVHLPLRVVLGHVQVKIDFGDVIGIGYRDRHRDLIVLSRHRSLSTAATAAATQALEQLRQVQSFGGKGVVPRGLPVLLPVGRRPNLLSGPLLPELIVGGTLVGILESLVGLGHFLEFFFRAGFLGNVRMVLARQPPVSLLDLLFGGAALEPEDGVVIFVFHTNFLVAALFWSQAA